MRLRYTLLLVAITAMPTGCKKPADSKNSDEFGKTPPASQPLLSTAKELENISLTHLVTLDAKNEPLANVLAGIAMQTGFEVKMGFGETELEKKVVTLKLQSVPFWLAIAEISKATKIGFVVRNAEPGKFEVQFEENAFVVAEAQRFGPLVVVLSYPEKRPGTVIEGKPDNDSFFVELMVLGLEDECEINKRLWVKEEHGIVHGFHILGPDLLLSAPDMKEITLSPIYYGGSYIYRLPGEYKDKKLAVRGLASFYLLKPVIKFNFLLKKEAVAKQDDISIKVQKVTFEGDSTKATIRIDWDNGLPRDQVAEVERIYSEAKTQIPSESSRDWLMSIQAKATPVRANIEKAVDGMGKPIKVPSKLVSMCANCYTIAEYKLSGHQKDAVITLNVQPFVPGTKNVEFKFNDVVTAPKN